MVTAAVREAIERAGVDVIAARSQAGVLAFGTDADVRTAFEPHSITDFDLHTFETKRQRYESSERGLLREALTRAIARQRGLQVIRRGSEDLLAPTDPTSSIWTQLRELVNTLTGTVAGSPDLRWREGIGMRLDWANNRLWLLIEPRTVFDGITEENKIISANFSRERSVKRYNRQLNDLVEFWSYHLGQPNGDLRALDIGDGIDAVYRLSPIYRILKESRSVNSEIASHIRLPEPSLIFHPDRISDCEIHPLRGLLRFGPYSAGTLPDPIRVATLAPANESNHLYTFMRRLNSDVHTEGAQRVSPRMAGFSTCLWCAYESSGW